MAKKIEIPYVSDVARFVDSVVVPKFTDPFETSKETLRFLESSVLSPPQPNSFGAPSLATEAALASIGLGAMVECPSSAVLDQLNATSKFAEMLRENTVLDQMEKQRSGLIETFVDARSMVDQLQVPSFVNEVSDQLKSIWSVSDAPAFTLSPKVEGAPSFVSPPPPQGDDPGAAVRKELASAASNLNRASDELGSVVDGINSHLETFNLGIRKWITIDKWEDPEGTKYGKVMVGYAKIDKRWTIAIARELGDHATPIDPDWEEWSFTSAPRDLRLLAIDEIPNLLQELAKEGNAVAARMREKTGTVSRFATAFLKGAPQVEKKGK